MLDALSKSNSRDKEWCGNYQGGFCPVRSDGHYFHLDCAGRPAYDERWDYVGDYREGSAVVHKDGKATHIDHAGSLLHGSWFLDLDVFHKGFARAKDSEGWMHINEQGQATYQHRFQTVEPFYNGQARVQSWDGSWQVINEVAETLFQIDAPEGTDVFGKVSADLVGFWKTQTLCAAVEMGVSLSFSTGGLIAWEIHSRLFFLASFLPRRLNSYKAWQKRCVPFSLRLPKHNGADWDSMQIVNSKNSQKSPTQTKQRTFSQFVLGCMFCCGSALCSTVCERYPPMAQRKVFSFALALLLDIIDEMPRELIHWHNIISYFSDPLAGPHPNQTVPQLDHLPIWFLDRPKNKP